MNRTSDVGVHESAKTHVTGESVYVDDMVVDERLLIGHVVTSPHAHARIRHLDLSQARAVTGVHAVLTSHDIPGINQMGPVVPDELCLAVDEVTFIGQAIVLIAAETEGIARQAAAMVKIDFDVLDAVLTLDDAILKRSKLGSSRKIERGSPAAILPKSPHSIGGELRTGAQEHWYLETQACLCVPGEDREIVAYSSTQHPSETQAIIAQVLDLPKHDVEVEVRRMGGAFGGKETQANHVAAWTALLCRATGRPVKIRLFRDDDQIMTGKRHRFLSRFEAGFDHDGKLLAVILDLHADGGAATDLSFAILERAMMHCDNGYFIPHLSVTGHVWKTNLPSNTAFRGFGGPQGMAVIEEIVDRIARQLHLDPADVRRRNFYGTTMDNVTHYGETIENNRLPTLFEQIMDSSQYRQRRKAIQTFNDGFEFVKRGMALTPVKFGISFTTSFLNQAGALVHIYKDGSILVNHGGTEMGQGLHTKIRAIAAKEFGVPLNRVKINATNTSKVPNTSATAASAGTDLNGMAVKNAIDQIKKRLAACVSDYFNEKSGDDRSHSNDIVFEGDLIADGQNRTRRIGFAEFMPIAAMRQVSLSSTGYYRTPDIWFDREKGQGRPFHYYAFGMAVTEVEIDTLTGAHRILRTDILHDVGDSIHRDIDIGQIEGGYIQGVGWCTTEEVKWDSAGRLLNHSPDTYKIPNIQDLPKDFRVQLLENASNPNTIHNSKAVAEPPFMLALSCWLAIKDAVSAVGNHQIEPDYQLPATNEVILLAVEKIRRLRGST